MLLARQTLSPDDHGSISSMCFGRDAHWRSSYEDLTKKIGLPRNGILLQAQTNLP